VSCPIPEGRDAAARRGRSPTSSAPKLRSRSSWAKLASCRTSSTLAALRCASCSEGTWIAEGHREAVTALLRDTLLPES
jgi:hypothetical protein